MDFIDESGCLGAEERRWLEGELRELGSLQDLVRWAFAAQPPRDVSAVHVQDEYTHDVVVPWRPGLVLAFDTT